ncbi:Ubiquinol-cytochrome C reductase, cytochrome C1 subunit [hydrothermal vent metagenome]|uniref:Ubiquinol-cytochrome C reductase, cytochrome C1 subunit n=2 Tax=hydrothermal vent metagenome TaxID=652676 RepID=A0A3B0V9F0_9ZZZZ
MKKLILLLLILPVVDILAAGASQQLESAQTNIRSKESLQNGAKYYMNYCSGCHSLQYQRYSRMAQDLELSKDEVLENLVFTGAKFTDHMTKTMDDEQVKTKEWFYTAVPIDLTVIAKARGNDWLYSYLKGFYQDPTRPMGWNNTILKDASMPNVLWQLQGIQQAEFDKREDKHGMVMKEFKGFTRLTEGTMSAEEFDTTVRDIVNFLDYTAEPAQLIRMAYAPWVMLFLVFFTFLAYMLKKNYFKDIH